MPKERQIMSEAVVQWEEILFHLGNQPTPGVEYVHLSVGYQGIDSARNYLSFKFMEQSSHPDDTLVMLDNDHLHPKDIVVKLASRNKPVVGALAYKRKAPFFPIAYVKDPKDGRLKVPIRTPASLFECGVVGGAALAIKRSVFTALSAKGYQWPWFRFTYQDWALYRSGEDVFFMTNCGNVGIKVYCDGTIVTPHLDSIGRGESDWQDWLNGPTRTFNGQDIKDELIDEVPESYLVK